MSYLILICTSKIIATKNVTYITRWSKELKATNYQAYDISIYPQLKKGMVIFDSFPHTWDDEDENANRWRRQNTNEESDA